MSFVVLLAWLGLCGACAFIARERGRSAFGWGVLAFFVSPVIAFLILVAVPRRERQAPAEESPRWLDGKRDESPIFKDPL